MLNEIETSGLANNSYRLVIINNHLFHRNYIEERNFYSIERDWTMKVCVSFYMDLIHCGLRGDGKGDWVAG